MLFHPKNRERIFKEIAERDRVREKFKAVLKELLTRFNLEFVLYHPLKRFHHEPFSEF